MGKQAARNSLYKVDNSICSIDSLKIHSALQSKIGGKNKSLNFTRFDRYRPRDNKMYKETGMYENI